jgi:ABC-type sugar transport system ATPase subunit
MIELLGVSIHSGTFQLNDVAFSIEQGEYAVLMGSTGCGKTTILETICGLRKPTAGRVIIGDADVTDWPPRDRQIGYVPQDLALFPTFSVNEHLAFALKIRRVSDAKIRARTDELASLLGIDHLLDRKIVGLSGGEAQRVALGRALAFEPSVLLLDEPLSALDESTRDEMQSLLLRIKESTGVTTLHVTHSKEEAAILADRRFWLGKDGVVSTK